MLLCPGTLFLQSDIFPFPTMGEACFPRIFPEGLTTPNPLLPDLLMKPPSPELSVYSCGTELVSVFDYGPITGPDFPLNPWSYLWASALAGTHKSCMQ